MTHLTGVLFLFSNDPRLSLRRALEASHTVRSQTRISPDRHFENLCLLFVFSLFLFFFYQELDRAKTHNQQGSEAEQLALGLVDVFDAVADDIDCPGRILPDSLIAAVQTDQGKGSSKK